MNDPNKVIHTNLSSLLSLKAELLRKQAEVSKAKASQAAEYVAHKAAPSHLGSTKSKKHKKDKSKDKDKERAESPKPIELEDSEMLKKSQRVLEAKSKFYEKMTRSGGKLNSDENCLVMFNRKKQEDTIPHQYGQPSDSSDFTDTDEEEAIAKDKPKSEEKVNERKPAESDVDDDDDDDDDEWVEFVDCLGRTRKCLREDLEQMKKRDKELADSMPERLDQSKANWMINGNNSQQADNRDDDDDDDMPIGPLPPESVFGDSTMSKLEEQKVNWERKEKENLDKSEVHYQDVFFDEARQHGVGYYAFSTDEDERQKQQRELEKRREQTVAEQKHHEELRKQREKIIAERVRAAKNRQRARQGLPPLAEGEDEPKPAAEEGAVAAEETKEERKARKRAEKLKKKQELEEQEREQERQQHVRPWDKAKDGVKGASSSTHGFVQGEEGPWTYKPEREPMTQEQWNEHKRSERNKEFAPVPEPPKIKRTNFSSMPPPPMVYNMAPPPTDFSMPPPSYPTAQGFSTFQSTKRANRNFQYKNYAEEPPAAAASDDTVPHGSRGAAIPPPSSLDADSSMPPHAKKSKSAIELERSIEAGLRFLRNNCDKGTLTTKSSWTAKADY